MNEPIFSPNKTSARLLVDFAAASWAEPSGESGRETDRRRYLLVYDLYIKARSYAVINKCAFLLAILFSILVIVWPSIAIVSSDFGGGLKFLESAVVQTTVTALAALCFAVYAHYKKRQMLVENLMRQAVYLDGPGDLVAHIVAEMERIDAGFSFGDWAGKKDEEKDGQTEPVRKRKGPA
ncbi:MAG: hypothetical protein ACMVY4_03840 [Minwuia sp.]|uniref:hypothetical protein n=1 Tax=Minwuia sp. TaxID=2493630 RepID=UPI003A846C20